MRLAFGICVGPTDKFARLAAPGIASLNSGGIVFTRKNQRSIFEAYNSMIDEATAYDVDGLILLHDDVVLREHHLMEKLMPFLEDPSVGIVGVIGARSPLSLEWWWYETRGQVQENGRFVDFGRGTFDVDVVDGLFMVLTRAALETVRFDTDSFEGFHGYDVDIAMQCRANGLRVIVTDIDLYHDATAGRISNRPAYWNADHQWRAKWYPSLMDRIKFIVFIATSPHLNWRERLLKLTGRLGATIVSRRSVRWETPYSEA